MLGSTVIIDNSGLVGQKFNQLIPNKKFHIWVIVRLIWSYPNRLGCLWLRLNRLGCSVRSELRTDTFSLFPYPLVLMQLPPSYFPSNTQVKLVITCGIIYNIIIFGGRMMKIGYLILTSKRNLSEQNEEIQRF